MTPSSELAKVLSPEHRRFADEWLVDHNGTRSYKAAYGADLGDHVACSAAGRLLRHVDVAAYIKARQEELAEATGITQERVLLEYARLAFSDIRQVAKLSEQGVELLAGAELSDDAAAALAEVVHKVGPAGSETKVKLHDKIAALNALAKHLGLFRDEGAEQTAAGFAALVLRSMQQRGNQ